MLSTRIRYIKRDGKLRFKNDVIISDLFYTATIDPVSLTYEIDTPNGPIVGRASSLHYLKRAIKRKLLNMGARFKNEHRKKRKQSDE